MHSFNLKNIQMLGIRYHIFIILSLPLVGNPSGALIYVQHIVK